MNNTEEKELNYIKIDKTNGQKFIKSINNWFKNQIIIDDRYLILHENDNILFPLIDNPKLIKNLIKLIKNKYNFEIVIRIGIYNSNYTYKNLEEALEDKIPKNLIELIPKSYDIIGNLAIIEFDKFEKSENQDLFKIKTKIAETIIQINKNIISVFEKKSQIKGTHRLRELKLLCGKEQTETTYKENNCSFKLDIEKCFFTPRLVFERNRIATSNIKENEVIIDLFAGVGPFSIQIAKLHNIKVYSFDINKYAYDYLKENIKLNKLIGEILPYNKNIKEFRDQDDPIRNLIQNKADRIIMNLPEKSIKYLDVACVLMKSSGGILHFYQFYEKPDPLEKAQNLLTSKLNDLNWKIEEIPNIKIVKAFSPKSDLIVIDAVIKSVNI